MQLDFILLNSSTCTHFSVNTNYNRNPVEQLQSMKILEICQTMHFYPKALIYNVLCIWKMRYCDLRPILLKLNCCEKEKKN